MQTSPIHAKSGRENYIFYSVLNERALITSYKTPASERLRGAMLRCAFIAPVAGSALDIWSNPDVPAAK